MYNNERRSITIPLQKENYAEIKVYKNRIDQVESNNDIRTKWFYNLKIFRDYFKINDCKQLSDIMNQLYEETQSCSIITSCLSSNNDLNNSIIISIQLNQFNWLSTIDHNDKYNVENSNYYYLKFMGLIVSQIIDYYIRNLDYYVGNKSSDGKDLRKLILKKQNLVSNQTNLSLQFILETLSFLPKFTDGNKPTTQSLFEWDCFSESYYTTESLIIKYLAEKNDFLYLQVFMLII